MFGDATRAHTLGCVASKGAEQMPHMSDSLTGDSWTWRFHGNDCSIECTTFNPSHYSPTIAKTGTNWCQPCWQRG